MRKTKKLQEEQAAAEQSLKVQDTATTAKCTVRAHESAQTVISNVSYN